MTTVSGAKKNSSISPSYLSKITSTFLNLFTPEILTNEDFLLSSIVTRTQNIFQTGEASIFLVTELANKKVITFKASSSELTNQRLAGFQLPWGEGVVGWTIKTGQAQLIADVQDSQNATREFKFSSAADERSDYSTRSIICAPLTVKQEIIGAIEIVDQSPQRFSNADLAQLNTIADMVAMTLQNARYLQTTQHRTKFLTAKTKVISEVVCSFNDFNQLLEKIADSIHLNFDFDYVGVYLINDNKNLYPSSVSLKAASGKTSRAIHTIKVGGHQVEVGDTSMVGWVTAQGKPCLVLALPTDHYVSRPLDSFQFIPEQENYKWAAVNKFLPNTRAALALPLMTFDVTIGAILIQSEDVGSFAEENITHETIQFLQILVSQLAYIIDNARSFQQIEQERQNFESIIRDIDRQFITTTNQNLTENLRLALLKGLTFIKAESGQILLYDEQAKVLEEKVATSDTITKRLKPLEGIFENVISLKNSALIPDLEIWEPSASMRSRLVVPLMSDEVVIGVFNAESPRLNAFNHTHQAIIETLAPQIANAIQKAGLFAQVSRRATLLKAASEVSSNAIAIRNFDDLLNTTVETIVEKFGFYFAAIFLTDETREWAVLRAGSGKVGHKMRLNGYRLRIGSSTPVGQATGPLRKPRLNSYTNSASITPWHSYLPQTKLEIALPLQVKVGKKYEIIGALSVHRSEDVAFAIEDTEMLQTMADQLAVAISNASLYLRTEAKEQLIEVLREIDRRILNPDESKADILNFILVKSCQLTGAESGQIFFLLTDENELKVEFATDKADLNTRVPVVVGTIIGDTVFKGHFLSSDLEPLLSTTKSQTENAEETIDYSQAYKKSKHSRAAVCLYEEDGNVIGVLSIEHTKPNQFISEHLEILSALAGQAAITIKNRALIAQAEIRNKYLQATAQVGADIISSLNLKELLNRTVELINKKFDLYYSGIYLVEEKDEKGIKRSLARLKAAAGPIALRYLQQGRQFEAGSQSLIGQTISEGKAQITEVNLGGDTHVVSFEETGMPATSSKMSLPLRNREGIIGALEVQSLKTVFTENDAQTLQTLTDQLAIAIYNAKLYQRIEEDKQQLAASRDIDRAIINTELNRDQTLKFILEKGLSLINTKQGSISLLEGDQTHLKIVISSQKEKEGAILPVDKSILGLAVEKQQSLCISDVLLEPRYQADYTLDNEVSSILLVPLKENETLIGIFAAFSNLRHAFSAEQQETLERLANQAAIAIKNASLFAQAERRAALLKAAAQVSRRVISIFDLNELLDQIVNTIYDQFKERKFHYIAVFLVDESGKYAWQRAGTGDKNSQPETPDIKLGVDDSLVSSAIQSGQGIIEVNVEAGYKSHSTVPLLQEVQSEMALPLKIGSKIIGALTVHSRKKDTFTDEDAQTLQSMADQLAIAIENVKKQEKLLEVETLKTIDEATSHSMHWVANKARPIKEYIERIEKKVSPILDMIELDENTKEDFFEAVEVIKENSSLILNVKQEIMGTAREFELVSVQLKEIIKEVVTQVNLPKQQIKYVFAPQLLPVWVDRIAIKEVFSNLFNNALQAMKNTQSPQLQIEAKTVEAFVEVRIIDNGVGIPSHKLKDIWIPFYTTKAGLGGTGVGLSYCLQAIHKMHGQISVESQVNKGTVFTLKLPTFRAE